MAKFFFILILASSVSFSSVYYCNQNQKSSYAGSHYQFDNFLKLRIYKDKSEIVIKGQNLGRCYISAVETIYPLVLNGKSKKFLIQSKNFRDCNVDEIYVIWTGSEFKPNEKFPLEIGSRHSPSVFGKSFYFCEKKIFRFLWN